MELIKHSNLIYEYKNFVDISDCDSIIEWLTPIHQQNKSLFDANKTKVRFNSAVNITMLKPSYVKLDLYKKCHDIFNSVHQQYINDNKFLNYLIRNGNYDWGELTGDIYFRTYDKKDYYDWHVDTGPLHLHAIYSYILYLNDDFEGGNTMFFNEEFKVVPKACNILCFPCDIHHVHKSSRILSGRKNVLWTCLFRKMG